jgi:hypothetical protein
VDIEVAVVSEAQQIAERAREHLVRAAMAAYEDAALRGLCCEGAWEVAVSAMRALDLSPAVRLAALPTQS